MSAFQAFRSAFALALPLLFGMSGLSQTSGATGEVAAAPMPTAIPNLLPPEERDKLYPFYMPMKGLHAPAVRLKIKCDASRAAGREVYDGRGADDLYGRVEGGFEFVYEALDSAGRPCVYPFAPWMPQIVGPLGGTQYIYRSSIPGRQVTFRTRDEWATIDLRLFDVGAQRVHFEMRDVALDFPGAIQPMGALHLEVVGTTRPGLLTAVLRRSRIYGGKNGVFVPSGQTMLYVEESDLAGNVGTQPDQQHTTYINGTLVSHFRNTVFHGQQAWQDVASGHQLKDKAYLRIYENVTVSNRSTVTTASAMPLIDASAYGFTWSDGLRIERVRPAQSPRDALVDLRSEMLYGDPSGYTWSVLADGSWRMPTDPLTALDKVYLSVFVNTQVSSFRTEPYLFALRPQGTAFEPGGTALAGTDRTTRQQQRIVSLAFGTSGNLAHVYSPEGWTYTDPKLPAGAEWVLNREAFIRHALGLVGR